jgi:hypothetical protein
MAASRYFSDWAASNNQAVVLGGAKRISSIPFIRKWRKPHWYCPLSGWLEHGRRSDDARIMENIRDIGFRENTLG